MLLVLDPVYFNRWDFLGVLFLLFRVSNGALSIAVRSEQVEYRFNLSTVARTEKILTAELHLFKLRPQATLAFNRHHFCQVCVVQLNRSHESQHNASLLWSRLLTISCLTQVSVYQLLDTSRGNSTQERKLLSSRLIPVHSTGWEVFTITQAVRIRICLRPA